MIAFRAGWRGERLSGSGTRYARHPRTDFPVASHPLETRRRAASSSRSFHWRHISTSPYTTSQFKRTIEMAADVKYVTLTDDNFKDEVLNSDVPVLVDFWATWCGPCRMIAPTIEELASEFEGRAKVVKVDVDANARVAAQYGIRSIPTLLFFKDGEVVEQQIGAAPKRVLTEKLEALATAAA